MPGVVWCGSRCSRGGVFFFLFRPCFSFSFRCVRGGVVFGVFGYVGEGNVFPCRGVLCFSWWCGVLGLKINLWGLFLGWVWCCFGVCDGVLGAWVGGCGVCVAVFRGFWWWCGVRSWRGGFGGVSVCGGTYYLPLSVRYALWCRFLFLGVENQPLGVAFRVAVWVRARFGGLVTGCGCDKSSLAGGSGGGAHCVCASIPVVCVLLFLVWYWWIACVPPVFCGIVIG